MATKRERLKGVYDVHGEKFRFLVVGAWNTVFSYTLFAVLLFALRPLLAGHSDSPQPIVAWISSHYYLVVQWITWIISVPQSTLALKWFAFRSKGHWLGEIGRSFFVYLPMQGISTALLWFFSGVLGLSPLLGQLFTVGINSILSYLGHKNFTFKTPAEQNAP